MSPNLFNILPIWFVYLFIILVLLLSIGGGIFYAKSKKRKAPHVDDSSVHTVVGAILGLLAFILAFTFNLTSSRFDARKKLFLDEVNSIETSWLRAGLVQQPYSEKLQREIVDYVEIRLWLTKNENLEGLRHALEKSQESQTEIWGLIKEMTDKNIGVPVINSLFINAINEMFDNQTKRVSVGAIDHIPNLIWFALFLLVIIAMFTVGYLQGKTEIVNWVMVFTLTLSFSVIIIIIVELDSPTGLIGINNQILFEMYDRIKIK